jgi:Family of unknown function (DUF6069)
VPVAGGYGRMTPMALPWDPATGRELPPGADQVAANLDSVTPIPPIVTAIPTTRNVLTAGWVTGVTAAIVCLLLRLVAAIFRVDFTVVLGFGTNADQKAPVPWVTFLVIPILVAVAWSLIGAIFLGVRGCQRWVFWLGTLVLLVSLSVPLSQPDTVTWPTKIWLMIMHVATWAIVVPQVARVVGDSDPRVTASYRDVTEV